MCFAYCQTAPWHWCHYKSFCLTLSIFHLQFVYVDFFCLQVSFQEAGHTKRQQYHARYEIWKQKDWLYLNSQIRHYLTWHQISVCFLLWFLKTLFFLGLYYRLHKINLEKRFSYFLLYSTVVIRYLSIVEFVIIKIIKLLFFWYYR